MKSNTLDLLCTDLLQACVDAYVEIEFAPPMPERRYVSHGTPVWSGDQLTVTCNGIKPVSPFPFTQAGAAKAIVVPGADLAIEVIRACWPLPKTGMPGAASFAEPDAIAHAATMLAADAATIFGHLSGLAASGGLFPSIPEIGTAEEVAVGTMIPLGPLGDKAGWRWPISVKLAIP